MMPCLNCSEVYSKSKTVEGWMKCGECDLFVHKSVQGEDTRRSFVTFVTKTGVTHVTLQFLQLKKTDHLCMSILQYL